MVSTSWLCFHSTYTELERKPLISWFPAFSGGSVSRMCTGCPPNKHGGFQDANRGRAAKAKATQRSEPQYEQWKGQSRQEVQVKSWSQHRIFVWVYKCAAAALPDRQSSLASVVTVSQPAHQSFFSFIKKITFCSEENLWYLLNEPRKPQSEHLMGEGDEGRRHSLEGGALTSQVYASRKTALMCQTVLSCPQITDV